MFRGKRILIIFVCLMTVFCISCSSSGGESDVGAVTPPPYTGDTTPVYYDYPAKAAGIEGMTLTFFDEFDGEALDESKWIYEDEDWRSQNGAVQKYRNANVSLSNGNMNITVLNKNDAIAESDIGTVTSGSIKTTGKFAQTYGRFEARMKLPTYVGAWPGFWMMPSSPNCNAGSLKGWPYNGEIDIVEGKGRLNTRVSGTLHTAYDVTNANWANKSVGTSYYTPLNSPVDRYHVYALIWTPDEISFEVDGEIYQTVKKEEWSTSYYTKNFPSRPSAPFDQDFYITFSCGVGGIWDGYRVPDLDSFGPAVMSVDYFRVYQFDELAVK